MYLRRVEVENFRCFEKSAWDFAPGFNVFIGDNGAGKTAILDAFAVAAGTFFLGIDGIYSRSIKNRDVRSLVIKINGASILQTFYPVCISAEVDIYGKNFNFDRKLNGKNKRTTSLNADKISNVSEVLTSKVMAHFLHLFPFGNLIVWPVEKIIEIIKQTKEINEIASKHGFDYDSFVGSGIALPLISYYGAGRAWLHKERKANLVSPIERIQGYDNCLEATSDEKFLIDWFQTREIAALQNGGASPALEGIREAVRLTLGEEWGRIWYDVDLAEIIAERSDGTQMPVSLLSDGQRNLLSMALDIAYRCAVLNPHLGEKASQITPGVVLIDEIDLHLHPNWQRQVVGNLRKAFPKVQFFITTHSPIILQGLSPQYDRVFRLDKGNTTTESPEEYVDRPLEDILTDVQGYDAFQMSARRQAMIEAAEAYYTALEQAKSTENETELAGLKEHMDKLALPFHDNPAYIAFLNMERQAALGERA